MLFHSTLAEKGRVVVHTQQTHLRSAGGLSAGRGFAQEILITQLICRSVGRTCLIAVAPFDKVDRLV